MSLNKMLTGSGLAGFNDPGFLGFYALLGEREFKRSRRKSV